MTFLQYHQELFLFSSLFVIMLLSLPLCSLSWINFPAHLILSDLVFFLPWESFILKNYYFKVTWVTNCARFSKKNRSNDKNLVWILFSFRQNDFSQDVASYWWDHPKKKQKLLKNKIIKYALFRIYIREVFVRFFWKLSRWNRKTFVRLRQPLCCFNHTRFHEYSIFS